MSSNQLICSEDAAAVQPIKVMAVDDHPLLMEGIASVLARELGITLVAQAATGEEALERARQFRPDVILMDIQLPEMSGIEAMERLLAEHPETRVIVLTTYEGDGFVTRAIKAGAAGYLIKSSLRRELVSTIRNVNAGRKSIAVALAMDMCHFVKGASLTDREIAVLRLVAAGKTNKRVGAVLEIAEDTVKTHMKSILSKLDASDRAHAVALGIQRGIIQMAPETYSR